MPQTVVTGNRSTVGIEQNSRVIDMSDTIHLLDPNEAPLTAITMKLNKVTAINPKFEWLEDDYLPTTLTLNEALDTTETGIDVSSGHGVRSRCGDLLLVLETSEVVLVISIATDTLTVTRAIGGDLQNGSAAANGGILLIIGNANSENSRMRSSAVITTPDFLGQKTTQKTALYGYTQIWRWEWSVSGTLQAQELYGGSDLEYQTRKAGKEHRIQLERSFLFGKKGTLAVGGSADTSTTRFTEGIINRITTNVTTSAILTTDAVETFMRTLFRYGPARKMLFASRQFMSFLSLIASVGDRIKTVPTDDSFPLALVRWVSPHGEIYLATHNLLEGDGGTTHNYQGWALGLDMDSIFYRPLRGRDTKIKTNIQANDQDGRIDGYLTEAGCHLVQEQNHAIFKGVTGYA